MNPRYFLAMVAFAVCGIAAEEENVSTIARVALSAPEPHPTRAGRLVVTTPEGLSVEYSPGQEADVQAVADRMVALNKARVAQLAREAALPQPPTMPLSAPDMRERRDEILQRLAAEIGLDAPTDYQRYYYNLFLQRYESANEMKIGMRRLSETLAQVQRAVIWEKAELITRLKASERVPWFSYIESSGLIECEIGFKWDLDAPPGQQEEAPHSSFNYAIRNGTGSVSASAQITSGQKPPQVNAAAETASVDERLVAWLAEHETDLVLPLIRGQQSAGKTAAEFAKELDEMVAELLRSTDGLGRDRDGMAALMVLHETVEVGLFDRYIGSRDRRWLCDGVANYVAWKIARDLAGPEFAREVYNLDAQLTRYAELQKKINLRKWPAVEHQPEADQDTPLNRAHYAFATRAIMMMAQQYGEESVPKLFRELGRTPRKKVTMKTVERAFAKVTGGKLRPLLKAAERTKVPGNDSVQPRMDAKKRE